MKLKISNESLSSSLLLIAFCIAPYFVNAQLRVMIAGGYGSYSMNDLTELQQSTSRNFPAKGRNISVYPGYYNFEGSLVYETKGPLFAGFIAGYGSSGARSWYSGARSTTIKKQNIFQLEHQLVSLKKFSLKKHVSILIYDPALYSLILILFITRELKQKKRMNILNLVQQTLASNLPQLLRKDLENSE